MKKIIIVDIDGTISDTAHRNKYLEGKDKDWKSFFENMKDDKPLDSFFEMIQGVINNAVINENCEVAFVTGRPENYRTATNQWLLSHEIGFPNMHLIMRPEGNFDPSYEFKQSVLKDQLKDYKIVLAIDDNHKDCEMYRRNRIAVLQVLPPYPSLFS